MGTGMGILVSQGEQEAATHRGGDTNENGQVGKIYFKYFVFLNLAQTLTIEGIAGTNSGLFACWLQVAGHLLTLLLEDSFPQCHLS